MTQGTFSNFSITSQVPDFNLALGDSVIIDMSNYWTGDIGCDKEKYIPNVLTAESKQDLFELRAVSKYLIVKAKKTGTSEISAFAEQKYDSDYCIGSNKSSPIRFKVTVGTATSKHFVHTLDGKISNWLIRVKIDPKRFSVGDTILVQAVVEDTSITDNGFWKYDYTWLTDNKTDIVRDYLDFNSCDAGYTESESNSVRMIVQDTSDFIRGFVHVQSAAGADLRNGLGFLIKSE